MLQRAAAALGSFVVRLQHLVLELPVVSLSSTAAFAQRLQSL
jgi:hypothetical protein